MDTTPWHLTLYWLDEMKRIRKVSINLFMLIDETIREFRGKNGFYSNLINEIEQQCK